MRVANSKKKPARKQERCENNDKLNHLTTTWNAEDTVKMSKLDGRGRANGGKGRAGRTLIQQVQHGYRQDRVVGTCAGRGGGRVRGGALGYTQQLRES